MSEPFGYLRHPALHGDAVVFVSDDDLWRVGADGGVARRLTAGLSEPSTPALLARRPLARLRRPRRAASRGVRDGRRRRAGAPAHVARPRRDRARLDARTATSLFVTTYGQPFFRNYRAFTVDPAGGLPRAAAARAGQPPRVRPRRARWSIGRNTADPARWKRYRGGTAGHLWIDARGQRHVPAHDASSPATSRARCGSASASSSCRDAEGVGNLYSCRPDGSRRAPPHRPRRVLRAPRADRRPAHRLPVRRATCGCSTRRRDATRKLDDRHAVAPHAGGAPLRRGGRALESALAAPGGPHRSRSSRAASCSRSPLWEGAVRQHGARPARGCAAASGSPTARRWSRSATRRGEERIVVFARERRAHAAVGHRPRQSRCGAAPRRTPRRDRQPPQRGLDRRRRRAARSTASTAATHGRSDDLAWSPDGAWLAYTFARRHPPLRDQAVSTSPARTATLRSPSPSSATTAPAFDPTGRYLYFLSMRTFDPVYDNVQFELSFPRARAAVPDRAAGRRAAAVRSRAAAASAPTSERDERAPACDDGRAPIAPVRDRPRRHRRRVAAVPGRRGPLRPDRRRRRRQGRLERACTIVGAHGRGGHKEAAGKLERFDFATRPRRDAGREDRRLRARRRRASRCVVREGKALRAIAADASPTPSTTRPTPTSAVAQERLDRPRPHPRRGRARARMAADAARGLAPAARPVLVGRHVGRRLGRGLAALRAAARPRRDARRASPTSSGRCRASSAPRTPTRWAATIASRPRSRSATSPRASRWDAARGGWRDHAHRARRRVGRERRFAAQRDRRRGAGRRAHRRRQRPAADGDAAAGGAARPPAPARRCSSRSPASAKAARAARGRRHDARRRRAGALPRVGRDEPRLGARALGRPRRLLPRARHEAARLRRVPPLLRQRVRARRADRRRPLQPRRPRLAAAAREGRAPAHRLRPARAGCTSAAVSRRSASPGRSSRSPTSTPAPTATSSRTASS